MYANNVKMGSVKVKENERVDFNSVGVRNRFSLDLQWLAIIIPFYTKNNF